MEAIDCGKKLKLAYYPFTARIRKLRWVKMKQLLSKWGPLMFVYVLVIGAIVGFCLLFSSIANAELAWYRATENIETKQETSRYVKSVEKDVPYFDELSGTTTFKDVPTYDTETREVTTRTFTPGGDGKGLHNFGPEHKGELLGRSPYELALNGHWDLLLDVICVFYEGPPDPKTGHRSSLRVTARRWREMGKPKKLNHYPCIWMSGISNQNITDDHFKTMMGVK